MTNIICNIEPFKTYIQDSSTAIFSYESNLKHDWKREISCRVGENEHVLNLYPAECSGDPQQDKFYFFFDLKLFKTSTKAEAKELLCRFADAMQFHPNIKVLDRTEHSEAIGYPATGKEPIGDDRYFWLRPEGFNFKKDESGRYCWDEVPEDAYPWFANMVVEVRMTKSASDHLVKNFEWGRSFDLNPEALTPVSLLRQAIRERDEKIAAEEARKRAEEEAELARQKALEEQVRLENEKNLQEWERVKKFVDEIGDFEVKVPSPTVENPSYDDNFTYMPIRQAVSFGLCSSNGYYMELRAQNRDGYKFVQVYEGSNACDEIIEWAVIYGAREPQQACV
jgi:hypothetical protein